MESSARAPVGYNTPIPFRILTPDLVETRIGKLEFTDGFPSDETAAKVFDQLDFSRAVGVFLQCLPAASMEALRKGMTEVGCGAAHRVGVTDRLMDSNPLFLTGNTDTVYAIAVLDLDRDGPTVVEIPPGCGPGTVDDAWFRFVTDMGAPGPDRGAGGNDYLWLDGDGRGGRNLDARTLFFYQATLNTPAMALEMVGVGSQYAISERDVSGEHLSGSNAYRLRLPANIPAKDFWSLVAYDPQTRSELQTSQPSPSRNSQSNRDDLTYNDDGSIDLLFGPEPPSENQGNWIETVPGKSWYLALRLYGPLESWFDKTWVPGDLERL